LNVNQLQDRNAQTYIVQLAGTSIWRYCSLNRAEFGFINVFPLIRWFMMVHCHLPVARISNIVWLCDSLDPFPPEFGELTNMEVVMRDPAREHLTSLHGVVL